MLNAAKRAALVGLSLVSGSVLATAPDMTTVTAAVTDASTEIALVGAAVLVMIVGAKVYKWIRRAL